MNVAIYAAPIPAVYLSPQAISPLSASNIPVALNLPQRVDLADPAGTTSAKLKRDQKNEQLLQQQQTTKAAKTPSATPTAPQIVLDGKVDLYV